LRSEGADAPLRQHVEGPVDERVQQGALSDSCGAEKANRNLVASRPISNVGESLGLVVESWNSVGRVLLEEWTRELPVPLDNLGYAFGLHSIHPSFARP
jgi:hypothetical protein